MPPLLLNGRLSMSAAELTPGMVRRRSSSAVKNAACFSSLSYTVFGSENEAETRPEGWKPVSTVSTARRLLNKSPAPASSMSERAIWEMTRMERAR